MSSNNDTVFIVPDMNYPFAFMAQPIENREGFYDVPLDQAQELKEHLRRHGFIGATMGDMFRTNHAGGLIFVIDEWKYSTVIGPAHDVGAYSASFMDPDGVWSVPTDYSLAAIAAHTSINAGAIWTMTSVARGIPYKFIRADGLRTEKAMAVRISMKPEAPIETPPKLTAPSSAELIDALAYAKAALIRVSAAQDDLSIAMERIEELSERIREGN